MKKANILLLLALTILSITACTDSTEIVETVDTEIINSEISESTEVVIESTEVVEDTETVVGDENESGRPDLTNYFDTHEFVGYNENYKCVKGDPRYEIIDGCYKGVPLKGDTPQNSWEDMVVWISPEGVEIKINDYYSYLASKKDIIGRDDAIWMKDPDKNMEPGSEWMIEASKFAYGEAQAKVDRQAYGSVDLNTLPNVATATEKRSSFNVTDELKAYAEQWTVLNTYKQFGVLEYELLNQMYVCEDYAYTWLEGSDKPFEIKIEEDYWKITISRNLNELGWHGLLTLLKNIDPDAELVYNAIYEQFYNGCDWILDYNGWYSITNSNSQIWVTKTTGLGYVEFRIK